MPKSTAIANPNLGLYLDKSLLSIPQGALQDGYNFRISQGKLNNLNLGWSAFASFTLNGVVTLIATLTLRLGSTLLVFGTPTDLYKYSSSGGGSVTYLTPIYSTGTASASGTGVTGSTTLWNTGTPKNVRAGDEISFGSNAQNSTTATWFLIDAVNSDTSLTLHTSAGTVGSGNYTIRHKFQGDTIRQWQSEEFINSQPSGNDLLFMTNGVDAPTTWNGTDATATVLNSMGIVCGSLCTYKNMMIYGNLVQGGVDKPTDMINSDVATPAVINAGLASQFKVTDKSDTILRIARLGDYLVIYLNDTVIVANFVGDPLIFVFRIAVDGKGIAGPKALSIYQNYHEFLGPDTLYAFDGSTAQQVSNHVWREVIRTTDPLRVGNVFTVLDESRGDYIWGVPLTTDPGAGTETSSVVSAFVEHYLETPNPIRGSAAQTPHSKRAFPFTAAGIWQRQTTLTWDQLTNAWNTYNFKWNDQFFAAAFPNIIVGDASGKIWTLNGSQDANGAALPSFVKFGRAATMDGHNRGLLSRIYPFSTKFNSPMTVTASFADFAIGPATIQANAQYDQSLPEGMYFAPIYRVGRFVDIQFGSAGPAQPWEISGYDIEIRQGGFR